MDRGDKRYLRLSFQTFYSCGKLRLQTFLKLFFFQKCLAAQQPMQLLDHFKPAHLPILSISLSSHKKKGNLCVLGEDPPIHLHICFPYACSRVYARKEREPVCVRKIFFFLEKKFVYMIFAAHRDSSRTEKLAAVERLGDLKRLWKKRKSL